MAENANATAPKPTPAGPGTVRAAAVLLGLGAEAAAQVFRLLGEADVRHIAHGAKELAKADARLVNTALKTFVAAMDDVGGDTAAGNDMLREMASRALGADLARRAFDGFVPAPQADEVLGPVAQADPEALAMVLGREQPQTVALVLSAIETERSALVLDKLPQAMRPEILRRMATIESVAPEVLREIGRALLQELRSVTAGGMRAVNGRAAALELLRRTPTAQQREVVAEIERDDSKLAADLRSKLFTFDDLAHFLDRDIQTLLKEVNLNQLTVALKGATATVKDKFLKNMSSRAAQMLGDDLQAMGAVRLSVVEEAQAEIAKTAVGLAEQNKVTIVNPTDKMV